MTNKYRLTHTMLPDISLNVSLRPISKVPLCVELRSKLSLSLYQKQQHLIMIILIIHKIVLN